MGLTRTASLEFEEQASPGPDDEGRTDRCFDCGSTRVSYENYLDQLFCWPCADGQDWPKHPRAGRESKDDKPKAHVRPVVSDSDLGKAFKDASCFTIGGRG